MNNAAASIESSRELPIGIKVGTRVFFGRTHGEKTLGKVVKINRTTVKVEQLEGRGTMRDFRVSTIWKVPFMFITLAPDSATPLPLHKPAAAPAPAWTPAPRLKAVIMEDITRTYSMLSPENLHCDGEISGVLEDVEEAHGVVSTIDLVQAARKARAKAPAKEAKEETQEP